MRSDPSMFMYRPLGGGRYLATEHTQSPWDPAMQHLGPVTALIVHELGTSELPLARLVVEIFGPVPLAEVEVATSVLRDGKRVQCLGASVSSGGREYVRATAWRIREANTPPTTVAGPPPLPAGPTPPPGESWLTSGFGYGRAMDWRFAAGSPDETGPATVWGRSRAVLVEGEEPTPLERLAVLADSGNGVSHALDFATHVFVNVDLTISLFRAPEGEWMCLGAETVIGPAGRGLVRTRLFDRAGEVGVATQTLFVAPR
ncbi:thioesterase family protein [Nonomuraea sp. NPDC050310]|uniref:thioesterase family protein n=1 Tax=Nonomuraea sp. NPDC050310 TaxID=3154935 RepID=UPI0034116B45